jgi:hypothetical protein
VVAPLISFGGQVFVLILLFQNLAFVSSGLDTARYLGPIDLVIFVAGLALAFYIKSAQPEKYKTLGRLIHEGL